MPFLFQIGHNWKTVSAITFTQCNTTSRPMNQASKWKYWDFDNYCIGCLTLNRCSSLTVQLQQQQNAWNHALRFERITSRNNRVTFSRKCFASYFRKPNYLVLFMRLILEIIRILRQELASWLKASYCPRQRTI